MLSKWKKTKQRKNAVRKTTWSSAATDDLIDRIINDEFLKKGLISTNVKNQKNSEYYKRVMIKLVARATKRNEKFSFSIQHIRSKFKICISDCKKVVFTIKTATGIKRFQDEKGYARWFDHLYPVIKSRDFCQMERVFEHSAPVWNQLPKEQQEDEEAQPVSSTEQFTPVKHKGNANKKDGTDKFYNHVLELIENDPTKENYS